MNKMFKKVISSVLAAVMTVGVVGVANVSSVFAANGDSFTILASDFSGSTKSFTKEGASISYTQAFTVQNYGTLCTSGSGNSSKTLTNSTGKTWDNEAVTTNGSGTKITITPVADGTITVYWYDAGSKKVKVGSKDEHDATNRTVTSEFDSCTANTDFDITFSSSNVALLEIDYVASNNSNSNSASTPESAPTVSATVNATWDFTSLDFVTMEGTEGSINSSTSSPTVVLAVDAKNGKLKDNGNSAQFNTGTKLSVPVYSVGDTVTAVPYPNYGYFTVGGTAGDTTSSTIEYTATEADVEKGYVEIVSVGDSSDSSKNAYIKSVTLKATKSVSAFEYYDVKDGNNCIYVIGKIAKDSIDYIDEVGFISADGTTYNLQTTKVAKSVADGDTTIVESSSDCYYAAVKVDTTDGATDSITITPYTKVGNTITVNTASTYQAE